MHLPTLTSARLTELLADARRRTLDLVEDLDEERMLGPRLRIVNPPIWEIGHVAWFSERWTLRHLHGEPPLFAGADELYDSAEVAHATRWDLHFPGVRGTYDYMRSVHETICDRLLRREPDARTAYFHLLALFHEDMHTEAFTYTRQTHGYPAPRCARSVREACAPDAAAGAPSGDVAIPGGDYAIGARPDPEWFVFDNEKWEHPVTLAPFRIARDPVTCAEFAGFVDAGGYRRREWWSDAGWAWRERARAETPVYWRSEGEAWLYRSFAEWIPLAARRPVIHVNWHEAEAYCRFARRRLPTEAEWEVAAAATPGGRAMRRHPWGDGEPAPEHANLDGVLGGCDDAGARAAGASAFGCRGLYGDAWEWTASDFLPYPGFARDPYAEYSEPWFGNHKVLRGGCWATRARLLRNTWRNYYTPDRRDVFAGFRTCAVE